MLIYIPLVPYGWFDYSLPEAATDFSLRSNSPQQFKPKVDLARAAAEELRASGIFKETVDAPRATEGDLVLYGEVRSTRYYAILLSYGLSVFAGLPWMIGFPTGRITNELVVEFYLEDSATRTVLWHKGYGKSYKATYWIYYWPQEFNYGALYRTILRDVVKDLKSHFSE